MWRQTISRIISSALRSTDKTVVNRDMSVKTTTLYGRSGKNGKTTNDSLANKSLQIPCPDKKKQPCPKHPEQKKKKSPCTGVITHENSRTEKSPCAKKQSVNPYPPAKDPCAKNTLSSPCPQRSTPAIPCPPTRNPASPCAGKKPYPPASPCPPAKTSPCARAYK